MHLVRDFFYYGPNRRTDTPVIEQWIHFNPSDLKLIESTQEELESRLNKILSDNLVLQEGDVFPFAELEREPMKWFCSLYAQLTILFQQKCGHRVSYFSDLPLQEKNQHACLIEYEQIDVGLSAKKLARKVITLRTGEFRESFQNLRDFSKPLALPGISEAIIKAARQRDIPVIKLDRWPFETDLGADFEKYQPIFPNGRLLLGQSRHQQIVDGSYCRTRNCTPMDFGRDRRKVSRLLDQLGIPEAEKQAQSTHDGFSHRIIIGNGELLAVIAREAPPESAINRMDNLHQSIIRQVLSIYRALDTALLEVDIRTPDLSQPFPDLGSGVSGLDVAPQLDRFLSAGSPIMVAAADRLLAWVFPAGTPSRVPVIAVTGTNGKTTISRMVEKVFHVAGFETGHVCTDGVYIDREPVFDKDQSQGYGHLKILTSPTVDAVVLECHHAGLATIGFAFDWCDAAICTNVTEEHIGKLGISSVEDMAAIKRSLIERAKGTAVLNADDPQSLAMAPYASAERTCLVSVKLDQCGLARLVDGEPCSCFLEQREDAEWIVISNGSERQEIMPVAEIPATFDGKARFNVSNAMQSIAACYFSGVTPNTIREAMSTFEMSPENTPWRLNFYEGLPFRVLVDFAHTPDGVARITEFTNAIEGLGRRILAFSSGVNRNDQHAVKMARAAVDHFDHYVVKNYGDPEKWQQWKTEQPERLPELLKSTLLDCGIEDQRITVILDEMEAVEYSLDMAGPGDLVVLLLGYDGMKAIDGFMRDYLGRQGQ